MLYRSVSNEQISSDFLLDFKGAFPFTMTVSKIMDFKENDLFQRKWTYFNEIKQIKEITDFRQFSRDSLPPLGVLIWKIVDFHQITRSQWNQRKWLIWTDFRKLPKWTDFSDSNEFSKESLIPFAVSSQKIVYFHINWTDFSGKALFWSISWGKSIKLHICSFSGNQYQTWNLLGLQSK